MQSNRKHLVIITGASSGIGAACAKLFSAHGYPLLLIARRKEILESYHLPNTICAQGNVNNLEQFKAAVKQAEAIYGPADLLINNAGIMALDYFTDLSLDQQYEMIETNLKGVINGINLVLPQMKKAHHGTIINISSVAGRYTSETRSIYNATKFGVHALSESIRKEVAPDNVRVLLFAPGIIDTNLLTSVKNETILKDYQKVKATIDQGLTAQEAAEIILYTYQLPQHIALKEILLSHTKQKI
ncbi:short-chain dehydrogenase/reductase SDR [Spiroplasma syrphidicola EA-1]|uniref:Short-chain dehydrogenase/reductase SDR n=1 Tax=Spiroplasma syrphidicola EA-1 TaxID=1276229 RepID=R4UEN0_9MOLU|nr:SDR family oxidoreductase [Spiroplasma syrphidicola]AGM26384.1 short-chain dehydrogenase/reductase SDR [Spiroplasma syrphidicola EA-1]